MKKYRIWCNTSQSPKWTEIIADSFRLSTSHGNNLYKFYDTDENVVAIVPLATLLFFKEID